MKLVVVLLISIIIFAVAAGIIVVRHQGTKPCISYYNKDGSHALNNSCD